MKYTVTKVIAASPETIWKILIDGAAYPSWNPPVDKVEGTIAANGKIKVFAKTSPGRPFPLKVVEFTPGKSMTWQGGMPLGLFKGVRTFRLTPLADGMTQFTMTEVFSGPMLKLIGKSIPDLAPSFEETGAGLKQRAERKS